MAERPPTDFDFDFDVNPSEDDGSDSANGKDGRGTRAKGDKSSNGGTAKSSNGDPGEANGGSTRGRARSRGRGGKESNGGSSFDPSQPSPTEKEGLRKFLPRRSRKSDSGPDGNGDSRTPRPRPPRSDEPRPKLIRAMETDAGEPSSEPLATPEAEPLGPVDPIDPAPSPEPPAPPEAQKAPSLADEDLLDSAFEEPIGGAEPAGELIHMDPQADAEPAVRRPRSLGGPGYGADASRPDPATGRPPGGVRRSLGGVTLPDMSGVAERLRALVPDREPERELDDEPGVDVPSRRGGRPSGGFRGGRFGGIKLPFDMPRLPFGIGGGGGGRYKKGKIKKLRLAIIFVGLGLLALVSTFFGMMMAVSSDLPNLENRTEFNASENSVVYDVTGRKLGTLTNNNNRILVESSDIAETMKQATVAIEDQRFYQHSGVDLRGMLRAAVEDLIPGGSTQGASTITQQFVKNALDAQNSRTVFEKFREAALAYHLEKQWDKDKILTQYLNTIYFGEGAYGIEAAARTYFGWNHPDCGTDGHPRCASLLYPEEAAMLAGIINSPSAFSPREDPQAALDRRNLVLDKEVQQGYLTQADADEAKRHPLPAASQIQSPSEDSLSPYFTTWLRQILVDKYGAGRAFGGGLRIKTTLDYDLQTAAEDVVRNTLGGVTPTSSIVVIDNKTGGIRAMVGGLDYKEHPFNLATNGHRQPGSAFKPFTLVTALENGHTPGETYTSAKQDLPVPNSGGKERFVVNNYGDEYFGASSIETATIHSDNSVFAQLGYNILPSSIPDHVQKSLNAIVETAHKMGVSTDITGGHKANPALILGGLIEGVTPLELAYAYSTIANDGERTTGSLAAYKNGPVPMLDIRDKNGHEVQANKTKHIRAIPESVATTTKSILSEVVSVGTGRRAQVGEPQFGKTGTTDNNGDAWFCGGIQQVTACVWVGHADSTESMSTDFAGQPVDGGTYPALMWAQVINAYLRIQAEHDAGTSSSSSGTTGTYVPPSTSSGPSTPSTGNGGGGGGGATKPAAPAPAPSGGGGGIGAGL
jgi:penicillin-binding protein 1A